MIHVRPAVSGDADHLAPRLRPADLREIEAVTAESPRAVLASGIAASSPCFAVEKRAAEGAEVIAVFGVVPDKVPGSGAVWLLGSEALVREPLFFLRASRKWMARLASEYPLLRAVIDPRNEIHLRWLRSCGFSLRSVLPNFGTLGLTFYELSLSEA